MSEDHFLHGGSYPRHTGIPRPNLCDTCAFRKSAASVRKGVSIAALEAWSSEYDDFVCHTPDADGTNPSCAGWHLRFGHPTPSKANPNG